MFMRIRENSPFYGITEEQKELLLEEADELSQMRVAELWEMRSGKRTTEGQVKRFLQRLRYERAIRDTDDSQEDWTAFSERARDGKARDGLIEAARQKLFEEALANGDRALLLELYKAANEERAREREVAVAQRKAAVAEENAMIGWSKVPGGRPMGKRLLDAEVTESATVMEGAEMKMIEAPKLRELLADATKPAEERIAAALACLTTDGVAKVRKLIGEGATEGERAKLELGGPGPVEKAPANIDWDAPFKALVASKPFAHLYEKEEGRENED
jgi:hypothetical protein